MADDPIKIIDISGPRVSKLPDALGGPFIRSRGGTARQRRPVTVRITGEDTVAKSIKGAAVGFDKDIEARARARAGIIQSRLQQAALREYRRSATGRFARGLKTRVQKTTKGASIQITARDYRETKFLTNLGGRGRFKDFPVKGYYIFARGYKNLFDESASRATRRQIFRRVRKTGEGRGRLRVPAELESGGYVAFVPGGDRRRKEQLELKFAPGGGFFYPLWVHHPGFRRDIVSEVAIKEGSTFITEQLTLATKRFGNLKTDKRLVATGRINESGIEVTRTEQGTSVRFPTFLGNIE